MSRRSVRVYGKIGEADTHIAQVTENGVQLVGFGDSASVDAFDRLRVSNPVTLFDSVLSYDKQPLLWNEQLTATGTSVHQSEKACAHMAVAAAGDKVVRQTKTYFRYQPGKSQLVLMTWAMNSPDEFVRRRVGYFDADNGIFLEEIDGALWIVTRSSASGSVVDTRVAQADWSLDSFDDLDVEKTQIIVIDLQWLGVGRVRIGFVRGGLIHYVHEFLNANTQTTVYMTTAQLPARLEIEALPSMVSASYTFDAICCSVMSEGGITETAGFPFATNTGAASSVSGTRVPILSVRPKLTFEGLTNRVSIIQRFIQVINTGNGTAVVEVFVGGALTGASWAEVEDDSTLDKDTSATAITGGHLVGSFYVAASNQSTGSTAADIAGRFPITLDIDGANPEALTIVITNDGTVDAAAALAWQEYR